MSTQTSSNRKTIRTIAGMKGEAPIVALTAYTAPFARILDAHCDILLVGDSLAMVLYGMEDTLGLDVDTMIRHGRAVVAGSQNSCVVVDMPFGSYQRSPEQAFDNAARIVSETKCAAVKMEGGEEMAETVAFLTKRGIPVMGHVGLMPQHVHSMGGYRYQGRSIDEQKAITRHAKAIEAAGAFSIVLEGVQEELARSLTADLSIPTIGIGASPACDGQVLVTEDMVGLTERAPKFAKSFGTLSDALDNAVEHYASEVRAGTFPTLEHCYGVKK